MDDEPLELANSSKKITLITPTSTKLSPVFHNYKQITKNSLHSENVCITFGNHFCKKDTQYVLYKLGQLKKKKFTRVLSGCMKLLKKYPNYIWAYLIAGAACRNYEKHFHETPFYFSQAVLINPNCLTAWWCLLKYYKENQVVNNLIYETIFSGLLNTERKIEKWCNIVSELLESSSGPYAVLREPLKLLAPFVHLYECQYLIYLSQAISEYLLKHRKEKKNIASQDVGLDAFKLFLIFYPHDVEYTKKILSYTFCSGDYRGFMEVMDNILYYNEIEDIAFNMSFYLKLMGLIPLVDFNFTNEVFHKILMVYHRKVKEIRMNAKSRYSQICCSYMDFGTARDIYENQSLTRRKGLLFTIREIISAAWSYIEIEDFEVAYRFLIGATIKISKKLKKVKHPCKKTLFKKSIIKIWLHILTHGPTSEMRRLGVLLCLKMLANNQESVEVLYYACIGCIGLGMKNMAVNCLLRLLKYGAINEIIYLKALLETSYSTKIELLSEILEFRVANKLKAECSQFYEKESKAFKSVCKASVESPGCPHFYEWLALFLYERGDYAKAEKYFEAALFYNPHSWTSIQHYPSLLAIHDVEASKIFLDLYRYRKKFTQSELIAFRAGLRYMQCKSDNIDYFKAAENFMYAYRLSKKDKKMYYTELIGETFSLFGMFGASKKWFSECYIKDNVRNIYAGSLLAKQFLFIRGVKKYSKLMRKLIGKGGIDTFICLYNGAHAFLLKSIRFSLKNKHSLSQIYCQLALFICARALSISSIFGCIWKLIGDILYQCGSLNLSSGFLYVPDWLYPECSSGKIILIRRLQSLRLAIRCYYNGINVSHSSEKMRCSLWNSIAIAYKKASTFCSAQGRRKCLALGIDCCLEALKLNIKDSLSWNTLGILLKCYDCYSKEDVFEYSRDCLEASTQLREIPICRIIASGNLGFLYLSKGEVDKAEVLFLYCRGRSTSLDFPWIGQILVSLSKGRKKFIYNYIRFIYKYTSHVPKIHVLFLFLNILSECHSKYVIRYYIKKYKDFCGSANYTFKEHLLSFFLKIKSRKYDLAKIELLFALRTANELQMNGLEDYNNAVYELQSIIPNHRMQLALLRTVHLYTSNLNILFSLCKTQINDDLHSYLYYELLTYLISEKNRGKLMLLNLALACINFERGALDDAKYFFLTAQELFSTQREAFTKSRNIGCEKC